MLNGINPNVDCVLKLSQWGCGQNLGLPGGSSCIHTKTVFEPNCWPSKKAACCRYSAWALHRALPSWYWLPPLASGACITWRYAIPWLPALPRCSTSVRPSRWYGPGSPSMSLCPGQWPQGLLRSLTGIVIFARDAAPARSIA